MHRQSTSRKTEPQFLSQTPHFAPKAPRHSTDAPSIHWCGMASDPSSFSIISRPTEANVVHLPSGGINHIYEYEQVTEQYTEILIFCVTKIQSEDIFLEYILTHSC